MKIKLLILALLVATPAMAQTSFYTDRALQQVNVLTSPTPLTAAIPYGPVRVCSLPLTQQQPCLPLATITDINGNAISNSIGPLFGQLTTDATGRFTFGCTNNVTYQVQVTQAASNTPAVNYPVTCPGGIGASVSANNTFIGNNTFTGTETFSGPLVNTGTDSGNQTISGNKSFTGLMTSGNINNIRQIDGTKFAKTAAGINAADADCGAGTACIIEVSYPGTYSDATITLTKNHFLRFRSGGTYVHKGIVGPDSNADTTAVWGVQCPEHATIQLAASSNVDQITTTNFLTLSGTNNLFGTYRFTLQGCILDGNKANQAALVTTGTCTVSNVARTAGGVVTITCSNTPSPAFATGMTVQVGGAGPLVNEISNDSYSFNGRFIVQSATATTFTYNQAARNTIASVAATGTTPIAIGYSGSNGVRVYGRNFRIEDNEIGNNVLDGLWNEGGNSTPFGNLNDILESTFRRNRFANSGGDGWVHWGPQNSKSSDIVTFSHGQWGRELFSPLFDAASVDFLNTSGGTHVVGFGALQATSIQPSSSTSGWGLLIDKGTGPNVITSISAGCTPCTAIEVRSPGHNISGTIQNSNPVLTLNGGSGIFSLSVVNNSGNLVSLVSEQGTSSFTIAGDTTSNTGCFSVAPNSNDSVSARTTGGTACNVFNIPTSNNQFTIGGWTKTAPTGANSTLLDTGNDGLIQTKRGVAGCTTPATAGSQCATPITVTWTTSFADTNYTAVCTGQGTITAQPSSPTVISKANGSITVNYFAITAVAASYSSVDCVAVHD